MNNKYLQTDKNKYLVLDENRNISIVNSDVDAREILNLENDIEVKENNYYQQIDEFKDMNKTFKTKKSLDKSLLIITLILMVGLNNYILYIVLTYLLTKGITTLVLGTNQSHRNNIREKNNKLEKLREELDELIDELENIKEKNNYKKENLIDIVENNYCLNHDYLKVKPMSYLSDTNISYNENKVKKLVKKPDIK